MSEAGARIGSGASLALAGWVAMFASLASHEILSFGAAGHGIIGQPGCDPTLCPPMAVVVTGLAFKAMGAGLALGLLGLMVVEAPARRRAAAGLWAVQYLWSLVGIASGYRSYFGATWRWWEPFAELLWHPVMTPTLMVAGLAVFLVCDLVVRPT